MPAFFGMRATRHMDQYDTTREQIAAVSVKNHENGTKYPHAHQQFECSVDDVKESPTVSYPLNLYDCCPVTDGACAVLVAKAMTAPASSPTHRSESRATDSLPIRSSVVMTSR